VRATYPAHLVLLEMITEIINDEYTNHVAYFYAHMLKSAFTFSFLGRLRLKCDGTRAETRFRLSCETDESI